MTEVDYYDILDVAPTASAEEIKAAYHRAVRTAHPDAGGTAGMFRLVSEAYRTLADPMTRAEYDARAGSVPGGNGGSARAESPTPPEPEWGQEVSWDAKPPSNAATSRASYRRSRSDDPDPGLFGNFNRWLDSKVGRRVTRWGGLGASVFYLLIIGILFIRPSWLRPDSAGSDLWGGLLDNSLLLWAVVICYTALALGGFIGLFWIPLLVVHVFVLIGFLVLWPLAYWDVTDTSERLAFVLVGLLWFAYASTTTLIPVIQGSRLDPDASPR